MKTKLILIMCLAFAFGCNKEAIDDGSDIQESAQQIGDVMASIDESGGGSGAIAQMQFENSLQKMLARYAPDDTPARGALAQLALPVAEATSCYGFGFGSCGGASGTTIVRNFNNCTVSSASLSGDVTLVWGGGASACSLTSPGQHITRVPNFTLSGRRGATLSVTKTGTIGQRLTWASGTGTSKVFNFSNDGINRKFTATNSTVFYDQTTTVSGTITVTGTTRASRVINGGGSLVVTNNLTANVCTYTPTNVTWDTPTCTCPTQGYWSGSCADGKSTTLTLTGCGVANYTEGSETVALSFDRCASN